jgi:predicted Zn-dependent protease
MRARVHAMMLAVALAGSSLSTSVALADAQDPRQAAVAQALYDAAVAAMRAGDFTTACPKLEQVVELAPSGIGAKLTLAECYEGVGKLASAWSMYTAVEAAAASANQPARQKKASDRAKALRPSLALLTVSVPQAVASTTGLEVRRDGVLLKRVEWGLPFPADKGKHAVVATAPGKKRWETTV